MVAPRPLKVVITGGPCAGKSSIVDALKKLYGGTIAVVPESATILFENGFPAPGVDVSVEEWRDRYGAFFQEQAYTLRLYLEGMFEELAALSNASLVLCDRGILDGAAYVPGGRKEFCLTFSISEAEALLRYDVVIHLESLSTGSPGTYSQANNVYRRESLEEAVTREWATRAAWQDHPRYFFVSARDTVQEKQREVFSILSEVLARR